MEISKENIKSNISGLNPTGTITFNGTYQMNGNNNTVSNSQNISKKNLKNVQTNKVVCSSIEHFENYNKKNRFILIIIILFLGIIFILYSL